MENDMPDKFGWEDGEIMKKLNWHDQARENRKLYMSNEELLQSLNKPGYVITYNPQLVKAAKKNNLKVEKVSIYYIYQGEEDTE